MANLEVIALGLILIFGAVNCQFYTFEEFQSLPAAARQLPRRGYGDFEGKMAQQRRGYGDFEAKMAPQRRGYGDFEEKTAQQRNPYGYGDFDAQPAQQYGYDRGL